MFKAEKSRFFPAFGEESACVQVPRWGRVERTDIRSHAGQAERSAGEDEQNRSESACKEAERARA